MGKHYRKTAMGVGSYTGKRDGEMKEIGIGGIVMTDIIEEALETGANSEVAEGIVA